MKPCEVRFETYDSLPECSKDIRNEVFVEEQGFTLEFDDKDGISMHIVGFIDDEPVCTCRFYPEDSTRYWIGRIAVRKQYRGQSLGRYLMDEAERGIAGKGGAVSMVSSQVRVQGFYQSLGYVPRGPEYLDEYCPHIHMEKELRN